MTHFLALFVHNWLVVMFGRWSLPVILPLIVALIAQAASGDGVGPDFDSWDNGRCEHVAVVPAEASRPAA